MQQMFNVTEEYLILDPSSFSILLGSLDVVPLFPPRPLPFRCTYGSSVSSLEYRETSSIKFFRSLSLYNILKYISP